MPCPYKLETRNWKLETNNSRGFNPRNEGVREATLHVRVVAVGVPGEIIFLHALGQLRRFPFELQRGFEPVAAGGDAVHALLIERKRKHIAAWHAVAGFGQQALNAARGVKAEIVAMRAPENLIDFGFELNIDGILCFFDYRIEDDEAAAVFQHPEHFTDDA